MPVRLLAPSPPGVLLPEPAACSRYGVPLTVTERRSRLVSLPSSEGTATRRAREPRGITTLPWLSFTSSLTLALKRESAAGLAGMAVSVLTLISVPEGRVCCALALTAVSPKSKLANNRVRFIVVAFLVAFSKRDAAAQLRVAPWHLSRARITELLSSAGFSEAELQSCGQSCGIRSCRYLDRFEGTTAPVRWRVVGVCCLE